MFPACFFGGTFSISCCFPIIGWNVFISVSSSFQLGLRMMAACSFPPVFNLADFPFSVNTMSSSSASLIISAPAILFGCFDFNFLFQSVYFGQYGLQRFCCLVSPLHWKTKLHVNILQSSSNFFVPSFSRRQYRFEPATMYSTLTFMATGRSLLSLSTWQTCWP